jgi:hypothetical protein
VIAGYEPDVCADILAGHYLGWLHRVRATVATFTHGRGSGVLCTLPLLDRANADPLAAALIARMTQIAGAPTFEPGMRI